MMLAALDYGTSQTKALIFDGGKFEFYKFSLSYTPQSFSQLSVLESLRVLQRLSGKKVLNNNNSAAIPVYLCTALPMGFEAGNDLIRNVESSSKINSLWDKDVLDFGYRFIRFKDRISVLKFDCSDLIKWLPFKSSLSEVESYIGNRQIYSRVLPISPRDLYIEQALARECISRFFRDQGLGEDAKEIVLSGNIFSLNPFGAQSLLIILDSLSFNSRLDVYLDRDGVISNIGLLKLFENEIFKLLPESFLPQFLCSVLRFKNGVRVFIDLELEKRLEVEVNKDSLFLFPLNEGQKAHFEVLENNGEKSEFEILGGKLGLVIDCRTFPLVTLESSKLRLGLIKDWERSLGATGKIFRI